MVFVSSEIIPILDSLPIGIYKTDINGKFHYANQKLASLLGFDDVSELMLQKSTQFFVNPVSRIQDLLKSDTDSVYTEELYLCRRDGTNIFARDRYRRFTGLDGIVYFEGCLEDISAFKEIPNQYIGNNNDIKERFSAIFQYSNEGIFLYDFDGKFVDANPTALKLFGYPKSELLNKYITDFLDEDDSKIAKRIINQLKMSGIQNGSVTYKINHKDGKSLWIETFSIALFNAGKANLIQGIAKDITKQKEIELKLISQDKDYADLIHNLPEPVLIHNEGIVVYANKQIELMSGYSRTDLVGRNIFDFIAQEYHDLTAKNIYNNYSNQKVNPYEIELILKNGRQIFVLVNSLIINFQNKRSSLVILKDNSSVHNLLNKLNENQSLLKDITNSLQAEIAVIDSDGTILLTNDNFKIFLSKRNIDITSDKNDFNISDIFHRVTIGEVNDTASVIYDTVKSVLKGENENSILEYSLNSNGDRRHYQVTLNPLSGGNDGLVFVQNDISDLKLSEQVNIESKIRIQTILDNSIQSFILIDSQRRILAFNDVAHKISNDFFSRDMVEGDLIDLYILPDDISRFESLFNEALNGNQGRSEKSFTTGSGELRWFVSLYIPVKVNGNVTGVVINSLDITERKVSEEKLLNNQKLLEIQNIELKQLKKAVEQSANSIIISDKNGIITYVNPACEKISGYDKSELIGCNANLFNSGEQNKEVYKELWDTISKGRVWKGEFINITKSGEKFWEYATISPVFDLDGEIISFIGIKEDISKRKEFEQKLKDDEEKIQALLGAIPDLMFIIDSEGRFVESFVPPTGTHLINPFEEHINRIIFDILSPELAELTYSNIQLAINNNQIRNFVYQLLEDEKTYHFEARMVKCGKDKVLTIIRDITKIKEVEEIISKQYQIKEVLTKWAGEFVNIPVNLIDEKINNALSDIGMVLDVDRVYLFSYNFDKQIAVNTHEWCNEGISPEINNLQAVPLSDMTDWVELHKSGKIVLVDNVESMPPDDSVRQILIAQGIKTVMSLPVINDNKCIGFVGFDVCKDVRKWHDEEILVLKFLAELVYNLLDRIESNKQKELAQASIQRLIQTKETLSKWASEFINVSSDEYDDTINSTLAEIGEVVDVDRIYIFSYDFDNQIATNTHEWARNGIEPQIDNFPVVPFENMMNWVEVHKRGELVLIPDVSAMDDEDPLKYYLAPQLTTSALGIPIYNNGECLGFVGFDAVKRIKIWNDDEVMLLKFLSDLLYNLQKRLQQQDELVKAKLKAEESDKLKSAFLANMSHEIRTPMNGIVGFSKLIASKNLSDEERKEYINIIKASSNRLMELINNILDISKLESGMMDVFYSQVDSNKLLKEIYNFYELNALNRNLEISLNIENFDDSFYVVTDHTKLYQILSYLVDNAIKFTLKGSVQLGCRLVGESVEFYIIDTGVGISEEFKPYLFERFMQEDVKLNRHHEGAGLGLAIVKGLSDLIGAKVTIESQKNVGTEVKVLLPFKQISLNNITKMRPEPVMMMNWKESVILIAEDDEINYKYIDKLLSRIKGITTVRAHNGKEAVDIALNRPEISLILMDVKMPLLDGHSATQKIKTVKPELPIIAVTAFAMVKDKTLAINAGCDDYLSKPFEAEDILKLIDKYLAVHE